MATISVAWVGIGANAGKVLTTDTLSAAWTGMTSLTANTTNFIEGTQSLSEKVSNTTMQGYTVNTTDVIGEPFNFSSAGGNFGDHIFAWLTAYEAWDTLALGGFGIAVVDDLATDSWGIWYVGPQPGYLGGWYSYVINPSAAFDTVPQAGTGSWTTGGNPAQLTGVDGFGCRWKIIKSITGNVDNCFVDCISVGTGYGITLGDAGSTEGKFSDFITFEENTTSGRFGGLRGISGILFARCKLYIGATSGATNTEFIDIGFTVVWEKAVLPDGTSSAVASDFYQLKTRKGSGSTTVSLSNGSFSAVSPHEVYLDFTGSTSCALSNINIDRARLVDVDGAVTWNGGNITNSGQFTIQSGTPTLSNLTLLNSTDAYAMQISAVSQFTNVSDITFDGHGVGGAGSCGLRLNLGAVGGASITLTNIYFQNRVTGSADIIIPADVTGHIIIIASGGSIPTVNDLRTPDDYEIVTNPVNTTVTVKDTNLVPIVDARVLMVAASGGTMPYDATVTITRTDTSAIVSHLSHAMATDDKVQIKGAYQIEYDGVFPITKIDVDSYRYTVSGAPVTPATGIIKATYAALSGLTDSSGQLTMSRAFASNQPVSGRVRKSTGSPLYKTATLSGIINNTTGFATTVLLISDE